MTTPLTSKKVTVNLVQLQGEVRQKNMYRHLLEDCLRFFNEIHNTKGKQFTSYQLATQIEIAFMEDK